MSVERSFEAWEEVQRQGLDLADRLAQGFTGLIQISPPSFPWPHHHQKPKPFDLEFPSQHFDAIRDYSFGIINQPINGVAAVLDAGSKIGQAGVDFGSGLNLMVQQFFRRLPIPFVHEDSKLSGKSIRSHRAYVAAERLKETGFSKTDDSVTMSEEEVADSYLRTGGFLGRSKSFMDLQFPNGQLTYVSGEGLTVSTFVPLCGGLLQAQGQYPGDMRFSYSCKNKRGTRITPMVYLPDKSFALEVSQGLAWRRSGLLMKPTLQLSVCPTFGGSNPGVKAEVIHSLRDDLNLIYGYALNAHPSAFASVSFGRSKWNGNNGRTGIVVRADTPLAASIGQPSFSVQLNNSFEF
ncbi:hypothetical protein HID58_019492 [Brassica napus]|uniref:Uncharacterized protein n=1 Tax=Brassica napus TaxID=3708 RepID=A0ABQ8DD04_BRANA|nr:hypothetical protein HID58_019492 [Brassica napus]